MLGGHCNETGIGAIMLERPGTSFVAQGEDKEIIIGVEMNTPLKAIGILVGGGTALVALGWLGLHIQPASFPSFPQQHAVLETIPLPADLPAPIESTL